MRIATYSYNGREGVGVVQDDRILDLAAAIESAPKTVHELIAGGEAALTQAREALSKLKNDTGVWRPLSEVRLLAPIPRPRKNVFCVGRNYKLHIEEGARARGVEPSYPKVPEFFSKPPTAVIAHRRKCESAKESRNSSTTRSSSLLSSVRPAET